MTRQAVTLEVTPYLEARACRGPEPSLDGRRDAPGPALDRPERLDVDHTVLNDEITTHGHQVCQALERSQGGIEHVGRVLDHNRPGSCWHQRIDPVAHAGVTDVGRDQHDVVVVRGVGDVQVLGARA